MSHITAEALRCDICGHTWLSEKKNPTHCAKCKSRKWNCREDAMYKALEEERRDLNQNVGGYLNALKAAKHNPKTCRIYKCGMCAAMKG